MENQQAVENQKALQSGWPEIKAQLHRRWNQLRGEDLERVRGDVKALMGTVQEATGATREEVERFLHDALQNVRSRGEQAVETARAYAHAAGESIHESSEQAAEAVREGYEQTQEMVRRHPVESLAVCFGVGLVTGVVVGLVLRSK